MFAFVKSSAMLVALMMSSAVTAVAQLPVALPESDGYIVHEPPVYEPREINVGGCGKTCACACGRVACCPTVEEVAEQRACWKVQCEQLCIPAVRLPWEPGGSGLTLFNCLRKRGTASSCGDSCDCGSECTSNCGQCCASCSKKCGCVKCVAVLSQEKYEATACKCQWEIRPVPSCCSKCCGEVECSGAVECGDGVATVQ